MRAIIVGVVAADVHAVGEAVAGVAGTTIPKGEILSATLAARHVVAGPVGAGELGIDIVVGGGVVPGVAPGKSQGLARALQQ